MWDMQGFLVNMGVRDYPISIHTGMKFINKNVKRMGIVLIKYQSHGTLELLN